MKSFLERLDKLAGHESTGVALWLDRFAFVLLVLTVLASPHSIAATQTFWILGMFFWAASLAIGPRRPFRGSFLAVPLVAFFLWSVISSIFSYAPDISIDKLRNAAVFVLFFYALNLLRNRRAVSFLATALIASCMINVLWMPIERIIGRGVRIDGLSASSPMKKAGFRDGDNLFSANDKTLEKPSDLVEELESNGRASVRYYRSGDYWQWNLEKSDLLVGESDLERLGVQSWSKGSSWRSSGFYGHYTTYAEVLQLVGSLTFGLLVASLGFVFRSRRARRSTGASGSNSPDDTGKGCQKTVSDRPWILPVALIVLLAFISLAMLLTFTRAAQAGMLLSFLLIALVGGGRKILLFMLFLLIPAVVGAVLVIQSARNVGFVDPGDGSTSWRLTVYKEGMDLWTKNPRNFVLGVGMDSIKRFKEEWHLFDDGRLQTGHFHSTPIQLLVERGLPALLLWLWIFGSFLYRVFRSLRGDNPTHWKDKGILLGVFGGVCGFLASSLVHYNYGDEEVVMVLYILMAFAVTLVQINRQTRHAVLPDPQ